MSRPRLLLLLAVLCLIRAGSGTGTLGWGTVRPGFICYRPLGAPARFLWPPYSAANRHRPPPAHRADACICRCHAIGYFFAVFIRRAQPLPGGGGPSNCFCMNHWNKKLTEVGAQHCRSRPDFWVAYKLMGNPKLASHCRGAREPYRGHSSQPPCDHCARSSSDRGPHVVHVFHHGAPTRPPSVQHVHINVHQNQLQNVQARGGSGSDSGSGSGGGAAAGAASNAVVNVHVNGQGGGPAGRGGTVVNNALGSRLEATAAGAGPGGQPSEAAAVQTASSESSAGTGELRGVEKRAGPCGGAPGGCGSCCKY
ncbi:hypothetical protein FJT64_008750 [Amphibalanus amphitrite]|uniref:Uncharacterized protein n=1 Tax=Amphibalanus amphitrite TaxID=1232801 RepID=A0A6A4VIM6_AMPAM|nr:hypothetical protein FJT64_008750 [Amphibalanus amphitrite]